MLEVIKNRRSIRKYKSKEVPKESIEEILKARIILSLLLLLAVMLAPFNAYAIDNAYYIKNYDVKMLVREDNSIEVTEDITVNFRQPRHGIYRYIPVENKIQRADGTSGVINAQIKHLKVSEEYDTYYDDNNNYTIQIGSGDKTVKGEHRYTISYIYKMGRDISDSYDELYYNIIGEGWDTYIEKVDFSIKMPKEFDAEKLGFSTGKYASIGTKKVKYSVTDNTVIGELTDKLSYNEALTVRLELPEGYFKFNAFSYYLRHILMILIPAVALIIVFVLWKKYGKDKKIVDVVDFYPPENLNSAEVAFWYKGAVGPTDTIALLLELANEGYVQIQEIKAGRKIFQYDSYAIVKIKDYDGKDDNKKIFFNGLFKHGDKVYESDLNEKFYVYADKIAENINSNYNIHKVFDGKSLRMRYIGWGISIAAALVCYLIYQMSFSAKSEMLCLAAGLAICAAAFIFSFFIRRRTQKGYETKQKINGFKIFLETAEKERLEAMVYDNPSYYYDILPFAYVLGVSDVWTKRFEGIAFEPPQWYYGSCTERMLFYHFLNSTMTSARTTMTSAPESSSSGFSGGFSGGGGGFSGGGAGGGGGGSW